MKTKRIIALLLVLLSLLNMVNIAVYAESTGELSVKYVPLTNSVSVYGKSGNSSSSSVNLVVMEKGKLPGSGMPVSIVIAKTFSGGEYSTEIKLAKSIAAGEYELFATSMDIDTVATFIVPDRDEAEEILAAVNSAGSAARVSSALATDPTALGLSSEEFSGAGDIGALVYAQRPEGGYDTLEDLISACRVGYVCLKLKASDDAEYVLRKYSGELGIDFTDYKNLTDSEKAELLSILSKIEYGAEEFSELFEKSILLARLKVSAGWVAFGNILAENTELVGVDVSAGSEYSGLSNTDEVYRELYEKRVGFNSLEDVKTAFDEMVKKLKSSQGSSGSSSSGGGSSSSKVVVTAGVTSSQTFPTAAKSDIEGHWAEEYILSLSQKGYMKGYEDGSYKPDKAVTRAEFLKLAECIVSLPEADGTEFSDVSKDSWYYSCVAKFEKAGIARGTDGMFCPDALITRQDAASIIYRIMEYAGKAPEEGSDIFEDEIAEYAKEAVNALAGASIISGKDGSFAPLDNTTRGEAAVIISKVIEYITGEAESTDEAVKDSDDDGDEQLAAAIACIEGLGFDVAFAGADSVTRGEFAALIVGISGAELAKGAESPFQDVKVNTKFRDEIITAYNLGYIEKDSEFRPDEAISGYDALRMVVKLLGYGQIAESADAFPTGYIKTANNIRLTKYVNGITDTAISGRNAAVLLMRALTTGLMDMEKYSEDGTKYVRSEDVTLLTEVWELSKLEGIVTATPVSCITSDGALSGKGNIVIDGVSYSYNGNAMDLIGRNVVAYTDDVKNIFIIYAEDNGTLTVYEPTGYTSGRLDYEVDDSKKKANTVGSLICVHNGKLYDGNIDTLVKRDDVAKIELIDNNDDSKYDIMLVTTASYVKVSSYDLKSRTIYAVHYGKGFKCSPGEESYLFVSDGKVIEPYDIYEGEYWALSVSDDGEVVTGEKLSNIIKTTINGMDTEKIITEAGEFEIEKGLNDVNTKVPLGCVARLVLNNRGRVFALEVVTDNQYSYAYIIRSFYDEVDDKYSVKLLNSVGDIKRYSFADRVMIDGISTKESSVIKPTCMDDGGVTKQGVVRIKLDENENICGIDLQEKPQELYSANKPLNNSLEAYFEKGSFTYQNSSKSFSNFKGSGCEAIFVVPSYTEPISYDEDDFKLGGSQLFDDGTAYKLDVFDINDEGDPGCMVLYGYNLSMSGSATKSALVESCKEVYDDEESGMVYQIRMWVEGMWYTYKTDDKSMVTKETGKMLAPGDIIRFIVDEDKLDEMVVDFDSETMKATTAGKNFFNKDRNAISYNLVSAYKKNGNTVIGTYVKAGNDFDYSLENLRTFDLSSAKIVVFDTETKQIESGDVTDINDYISAGGKASTFLVRHRYFQCNNLLVIYR